MIFDTKGFAKGLVYKKGKILLTFVEIVEI